MARVQGQGRTLKDDCLDVTECCNLFVISRSFVHHSAIRDDVECHKTIIYHFLLAIGDTYKYVLFSSFFKL